MEGIKCEVGLEKHDGTSFKSYSIYSPLNGKLTMWIERIIGITPELTKSPLKLTPGKYRLVIHKNTGYPQSEESLFSEYGYINVIIQDNVSSFASINRGAGLRVKRIINNIDGKEEIRSFKYQGGGYTKTSSGLLMSTPSFHAFSSNIFYYPTRLQAAVLYIEMNSVPFNPFSYSAQGSPVGYSSVEELIGENGEGGIMRYNFYNDANKLYLSELSNFFHYPSFEYFTNGLLKSVYALESNNKMKSVTNYEYINFPSKVQSIKGFKMYSSYGFSPSVSFKMYSNRTEAWRLKKEITYEYIGRDAITTVKENEYDNNYLINKQTIRYGSKGESIKTVYKYSFDNDDEIGVILKNKHILEVPMEEINLMDNEVISAKKTEYTYRSKMILPHKYYSLKYQPSLNLNNYSNNYDLELTLDNYTQIGKIGSQITKSENRVFYLWSYDGQYPIAEIKNASYSDVQSALQKQGKTIESLSAMTIPSYDIDKLRKDLPNTMITTYTYKPLVGVLTVTDPTGSTIYYEYDAFGRLKRTFLKQKNMSGMEIEKNIQSYDYRYKNQ